MYSLIVGCYYGPTIVFQSHLLCRVLSQPTPFSRTTRIRRAWRGINTNDYIQYTDEWQVQPLIFITKGLLQPLIVLHLLFVIWLLFFLLVECIFKKYNEDDWSRFIVIIKRWELKIWYVKHACLQKLSIRVMNRWCYLYLWRASARRCRCHVK